MARVADAVTAFAHRGNSHQCHGYYGVGGRVFAAARAGEGLHGQIVRQATAGLLLPNFSDAADGPTPEQLGADHAARLRTVRRLHDPAGVFGGQGGR